MSPELEKARVIDPRLPVESAYTRAGSRTPHTTMTRMTAPCGMDSPLVRYRASRHSVKQSPEPEEARAINPRLPWTSL